MSLPYQKYDGGGGGEVGVVVASASACSCLVQELPGPVVQRNDIRFFKHITHNPSAQYP